MKPAVKAHLDGIRLANVSRPRSLSTGGSTGSSCGCWPGCGSWLGGAIHPLNASMPDVSNSMDDGGLSTLYICRISSRR